MGLPRDALTPNAGRKLNHFFLNPERKPIDEISDWLCRDEREGGGLRRMAEGVRSLAHVMVVVPTAQSGRRLRLRIAERLGSVVPPEIRLPQQLLERRDRGSGDGDCDKER